jgi:ubiquinone/menaquinone biosynthesis C-methylase UbiE
MDVGGGPGTYGLEACRRFPDLQAVVVDLPEVKLIFEEHRKNSPSGEKVRFVEGNVHSDPLPEGCDAVLLSNVIHSWSSEQNQSLLKKVDRVIAPGGLLIIKDFFISEDGTKPFFAALFSVNMLLGTPQGRCYTRSEVESWLAETSFKPVGFVELTEQAGVLQAMKDQTHGRRVFAVPEAQNRGGKG